MCHMHTLLTTPPGVGCAPLLVAYGAGAGAGAARPRQQADTPAAITAVAVAVAVISCFGAALPGQTSKTLYS